MVSIKKDGRNIKYVSEELKNNRDIAMVSIKKEKCNKQDNETVKLKHYKSTQTIQKLVYDKCTS